MAKRSKQWRVKPEYDGRVTIEKENHHVVLSSKLSQEQLASLVQLPNVAAFLERVTLKVQPTNEEQSSDNKSDR